MSMQELLFDYSNSGHKGESLVTNAENGDVAITASDMTNPVYYPTLWKIYELVVPVLDLGYFGVTQVNEGADEAWATAKYVAFGSGMMKAVWGVLSTFMANSMLSLMFAGFGIA